MNPANRPDCRRYIRAVLRANGVQAVEALEITAALEIMAVLVLRELTPSMQEFGELMNGKPPEAQAEQENPERSLETLMRGM